MTALKECSGDNLEFLRNKALGTVYDLLAAKPEEEHRLLPILVNKLGDPSKKVASQVNGGAGV